LALGYYDGGIKIWDLRAARPAFVVDGHSAPVLGLEFSPDGRRLASCCADSTVRLWDTATGQEAGTLLGHTDRGQTVSFSPRGLLLASAAGGEKVVRIWDATPLDRKPASGSLAILAHDAPARGVAFNADGRRLASCAEDGSLKLFDATTGQE